MTNGIVPQPPQSPTQIPSPLFSAIPPSVPVDRHIRRGQDEYAHALSALLPRGIAWPRWPEAVIMKFVYGVAGIMGWADGRAADLLEIESDPRSTTEMLDSWEKAWGLPDPCFRDPQSIEERRKVLVMWMTLLGAQSREFFIGIANYLGYAGVSISEYRPFMVGVDGCGDNRALEGGLIGDWPCQIGSPSMRFAWTVHVPQTKLVWFRAASGQAGIDPLLHIALDDDLECILRRWGPAHTLPLFDYSSISDPFAGADPYNVTLRDGEPVGLRDATVVVDTRPTMIYWPPPAPYFWLQSPTFDAPTLVTTAAVLDPSTIAWRDTVITKGGTVSDARATIVDLVIKRLKADGTWPLFDRIWLFAGENQVAELIDIVHLAQATVVGNVAFVPDQGFATIAGYINTNFNPATAPARKYTRNKAMAGVWSLGSTSANYNMLFGQVMAPVGYTFMDVNHETTLITEFGSKFFRRTDFFGINDSNTQAWNFYFFDDYNYGFYAMNRSDGSNSQAYRNGRQIQFSSNPSIAPDNSPFTFGHAGMGGVDYYCAHWISIGCFGADLTPDQHLKVSDCFLGYMRAINAVP